MDQNGYAHAMTTATGFTRDINLRVDIAERLRYFDPENTLPANARIARSAVAGHEREIVDCWWAHHIACVGVSDLTADKIEKLKQDAERYVDMKFSDAGGQRWADMAGDHARMTYLAGEPIALMISCYEASNRLAVKYCREKLGDGDEFRRASNAVFRLAMIEAEVISSTMAAMKAREVEQMRVERADMFREKIAAELTSASDLGTQLRGQASDASGATRGMLGKASEVAAAAEQSAVAMRDAAHTAAGLIRAIEEARSEVEAAADIATRASDQAADAVKVSEALSETAKSIESILGLIRDVAGQTNLLALNATIEAARAGDAGRGFAVVAQEVKSLANQTARATDDIAAKIAAIQSATRSTVETNGSIRATVAEVQLSATRIRHAMETQAQTVTMITAAVDETALAADTMSLTIAAIRQDTETVATEIDELETGFDSVNRKLAMLQDAAGDYVRLVA